MILFSVNGQALDMPAGLNLQFQRKNILFSFDSVSVERTTNFNIPATPKNMRIFGFANSHFTRGEDMRVKIPATLTYGVLTKSGVLHISKYNVKNKTFECVFLTGELEQLKRIKDAGNLSEFYFPKEVAEIDGSSAGYDAIWTPLTYAQNYIGNIVTFPSYNIKRVLEGAFAALGVQGVVGEYANDLRIIPSSMKRGTRVTFESTPSTGDKKNALNFSNTMDTFFSNVGENIACNNIVCEVHDYGAEFPKAWRFVRDELAFYIDGFSFDDDVTLTFPDTFPSNIALVRFLSGTGASQFDFVDGFVGDYRYKFDIYTGDFSSKNGLYSLAGLSVDIPANTSVGFLRMDGNYQTKSPAGFAYGYEDVALAIPAYPDGMPAFSGDFEIRYTDENKVSLYDNLEERKITDILKDVAAIGGNLIDVQNGVIILDRDFSEMLTKNADIELRDVISESVLERSFSDYAQRSTIDFKQSKNVKDIDRIFVDYVIDNKNIQETKNLLTIGWNEGGSELPNTEGVRLIAVYPNTVDDINADVYMVASVVDFFEAGLSLTRVGIIRNQLVDRLVEKSTSISVTVRMKLFEFDKIKSDTVFWYNGSKWVWTSAKWSKDTITLELAQL